MEAIPESVMARLNKVHDPRRREGQRYRFKGLLAMLLLAALHGETSLRGMWLWCRNHWDRIAEPLDLWATPGAPAYGTLWGVLAKVDAAALGAALCLDEQAASETAYSVDGKVLRGSRRGVEAALQVVTAAGHSYRAILGEQVVVDGDSVAAAVALLYELPVAGKLVSLDAGLLQRAVVKAIEEKGGPTSGM